MFVWSSGQMLQVSPTGMKVLEPRLVPLFNATVGALWLERVGAVTTVWLAALDTASISAPVEVMQGYFHEDTLAAAGSGLGRVAIAVPDRSLSSTGLAVRIVAPFLAQDGGLRIAQTGNGLNVSWSSPSAFPSSPDMLETSADLLLWSAFAGHMTYSADDRISVTVSAPLAERQRFFRVRTTLW